MVAAHILLEDTCNRANTNAALRIADIPLLRCEVLDCLYACGLAIIASRTMKITWMSDKQQEQRLDTLGVVREHFLCWEQSISSGPLITQVSHCSEAFAFFSDHFYDARDPYSGIENLGLPHTAWRNLYQRLDLDLPWPEGSKPTFRTLGLYEPIPFLPWMESLPVDFDD